MFAWVRSHLQKAAERACRGWRLAGRKTVQPIPNESGATVLDRLPARAEPAGDDLAAVAAALGAAPASPTSGWTRCAAGWPS